jgi:preprotein translocase subunit SecG
MLNLQSLMLIAHVLISVGIILLVLLQRGKGADAGAAFGSGASGTVFGAKGSANFLSRSTATLATLFFLSSLSLAYLGSSRPVATSLMDQEAPAGIEIISSVPGEEETAESIESLPGLPELEGSVNEGLPEPEPGEESGP